MPNWLDDDPGSEEARRQCREEQAKTAPNGRDREIRFELIDASELKLNKRCAYLVKFMIPAQGLIVVWGPPKCGKSFWILDVIFHIALGWQYRGRRVKQGLVVYIGCEGEFAVPARIEAFRQEKIRTPIDPNRFKLILTRLDLVDDIENLISDIKAQLADRTPAVLVIDTLNRSLKGSESSDEDMGNYIKATDRLREEFRCAVAIVHHCGYNADHPRGHTSLAGAVDAQIAVKKDASGLISTVVEWMKDGPEGEETASRFKVITNLDVDEDGEPISSCVLEPAKGDTTQNSRKSPLSPSQKRALELLAQAITKAGTVPTTCNHIPANTPCVSESLWREYCYAGRIARSDNLAAKQKAFKRAAAELVECGSVGKWGDYLWIKPRHRDGTECPDRRTSP